MKGWVMVEPDGIENDDQLAGWIERRSSWGRWRKSENDRVNLSHRNLSALSSSFLVDWLLEAPPHKEDSCSCLDKAAATNR